MSDPWPTNTSTSNDLRCLDCGSNNISHRPHVLASHPPYFVSPFSIDLRDHAPTSISGEFQLRLVQFPQELYDAKSIQRSVPQFDDVWRAGVIDEVAFDAERWRIFAVASQRVSRAMNFAPPTTRPALRKCRMVRHAPHNTGDRRKHQHAVETLRRRRQDSDSQQRA